MLAFSALQLKQAWQDGTTSVVFTPHELIEELIPLIPHPRAHVVRYHGILGPATKKRDQVVSRTGPVEIGGSGSVEPREIDPSNLPRFSRLPWALLLKRVLLVDVLECPKCKGGMKILAAVIAPTNVRRIVESLGLPSEAPRLQAARPPPQLELVDGGTHSDAFYADPPSPEE